MVICVIRMGTIGSIQGSISTQTMSAVSLATTARSELRHDRKRTEVAAIYRMPLPELIFRAQNLHRQFHERDRVQTCQLISIKMGGCPEDCGYCPQSTHYDADVEGHGLMDAEHVIGVAREAAERGVTRFCMGAAQAVPVQP